MYSHDILKNIKALADDTRLRLAYILCHYELSVNELVSLLNMGQSRVSRHLKILTDAGLLQARRDGLWVFYKAVEEGENKEFLSSVFSFLTKDIQNDLDLASRIIEERAIKTRQFFNSIADDWDELNKEVLGSFSLPCEVKNSVPARCGTAVDLGCGTGEVLEKLLEVSNTVIGVDGSPKMLELARRRFNDNLTKLSHLSLRIGELDHLPLRDNEANFACINLVLHHLSDPKIALDEIQRVLSPKGILFISDFVQHKEEKMRSNYGDRWLGFSKETLEAYMRESGFDIIQYKTQKVKMGLELHLLIAQKS